MQKMKAELTILGLTIESKENGDLHIVALSPENLSIWNGKTGELIRTLNLELGANEHIEMNFAFNCDDQNNSFVVVHVRSDFI